MQNYMVVFLGAGLGGIIRYWSSDFIHKISPSSFPYGTLFVNVLGSFLLGIIMYYFDSNELIDVRTRIFLTTGICGGLTTFSTFSFETINLMKEREFLFAGFNIITNILITLLALFLAYKLSKFMSGA